MYPYFYIGFDLDINSIKAEELNIDMFKVLTEEEALAKCSIGNFKTVQIIAGTPDGVGIGYKPIKLQDFIDSGSVLPNSYCNLKEKRNIQVYLNGRVAEDGEDYEITKDSIRILWDVINQTDVFSFSIPIVISGGLEDLLYENH